MNKNFCFFILIIWSVCLIHAEAEIDLKNYELRRISQNGEDGILEKIFQLIGTTNKYYVEFGAGDGHWYSNVKHLRENHGWSGLLLDGGCYTHLDTTNNTLNINLNQEFVTAENICDLFEKYHVPNEFDLISIDIDGNDFYVWNAVSKKYNPRVVVIEYNSNVNFMDDKVMRYDPNYVWDGSLYYGASILAFLNLGRKLGYSLVYAESNGANLFFVRDDVLILSNVKFKNINNVAKMHKYPGIRPFLDPKIVSEKFISGSVALR